MKKIILTLLVTLMVLTVGVVNVSADENVAKIGKTEYPTFAAAIGAAPEETETTITMIANATENFSKPIIISGSKKITLDLNGHAIEGKKQENGKDFIWVENGCELTIIDSGTNGLLTSDAYNAATIYVEGKVILESGTVKSTGNPDVDLGGCVFDVRPNDFGNTQGYVYKTNETSLIINGGVVYGNNSNTIRVANSAVELTRKNQQVNVVMNGGTIENGGDAFFIQLWTGIKCIGNLSLEINGGELKCKRPIRAFSTSWTTNKEDGQGSINIAINGGRIQGYNGDVGKTYWKGVAVQNIAGGGTVENVESFMNVAIKGGYYSYNNTLADGLLEGYEIVDNEDLTTKDTYPYMIGKKEIAKIGDTTYPSLERALEAATQGDTIVLLKNIDFGVLDDKTTGVKINKDKNVVLDLNGFTISGSKTNKNKNVYIIQNNGVLTITDNSASKTGKVSLDQDTTVWNYETDGVAIENHGDLIVNGGTIQANRSSTGMVYAIDNRTGYEILDKVPSLVLNGGLIKSDYAAIRMYAQNIIGTDSIKAIVNNADINSDWAFFLQDESSSTNKIDIEINGGKFDSGKDMFFVGTCSNNISKILINKAENENIISDNDRSLITYDYNGANNKVEFIIKSGIFSYPENVLARQINYSGNKPNAGIQISGGWFSSKVPNTIEEDYVVSGYKASDDLTGKGAPNNKNVYTVIRDVPAAELDNKEIGIVKEGGKDIDTTFGTKVTIDETLPAKEKEKISSIQVSNLNKAISTTEKNNAITSAAIEAKDATSPTVEVEVIMNVGLAKSGVVKSLAETIKEDKADNYNPDKVEYIDITIDKIVKANGNVIEIKEIKTTDSHQIISFPIASVFGTSADKERVFVYRNHIDEQGRETNASFTKVEKDYGPIYNGECYWIDGDIIYIKANRFSVYGFGIQNTIIPAEKKPTPTPSHRYSVPNTGIK